MNSKLSEQQIIDTFLAECAKLNGKEIQERPPWHQQVTLDAIRHVAHGISDDNPLWTDRAHAASSAYRRPIAPPAFLCSVMYPVLHGAPVQLPLASFITELGFEWYLPVLEGDVLRAASQQQDAFESRDRRGKPMVCILSETRYFNQREELVGLARSTLARAVQDENDLRIQRDVYRYSEIELEQIAAAQCDEFRRGSQWLDVNQVEPGCDLPSLVRGPLTIGDMVCWQAAIGPSYRPGALGYRDTLQSPHTTVIHPITGWPIKHSQQHEDFLLAPQRGMPAPFDNGLMRFAWITPVLTNWIGDDGWLQSLIVRLHAPNLYGDTTWYRGIVVEKSEKAGTTFFRIEITGTNQLGETTTSGEALVCAPSCCPVPRQKDRSVKRSSHQETKPQPLSLIHRAFESTVATHPDACAVATGDLQLSYREVNGRANRLARQLREQGFASGAPVVVCLRRSAEWIIAELAVLKAGAALVPLDPNYPPARLQKMLADCQPQMAIATADLAPIFKEIRVPLIDPLQAVESIVRFNGGNLDLEIDESQCAYILYTSGSTGEPNGVVVPHRSLAIYIDAMRESLKLSTDDVYLHTASFAFSAAIRQVFFPLSVGAKLVVVSEEDRRDPLALLKRITRERATVWDTVPSALQQAMECFGELTDSQRRELSCNHLRLVLSTGEALTWDVAGMYRNTISRGELVNLYSQTETTGTTSIYRVPGNPGEQRGAVPLGRAVSHTNLYLLGPDLNQVPEGEPGEVWVGGDRLASHYLNRPDLTDLRFKADPFQSQKDSRMYSTGDLGRRRPDGVVEFLGRVDDRINLRGYRIEPVEVEAHISALPEVRQAVVVKRQDPTGDTRLVAYVAARSEACPTVGGARRYELPNGLAIAQANKHETDFTYRAIFEDQTYLKHGVTLRDGDCVVDVGANIGLFSLFVGLVCRKPKIYSLEPNPEAFEILQTNTRLYGLKARLLPYGLDQDEGSAAFTAFSGFSILSGLHADATEEKELVREFTANQQDPDELMSHVDEILAERFKSRSFDVPIKTLSSVIEEEGIERIDLLKVNVEKSELGVLRGICSQHWDRIEQVVVKVDVREHLPEITQLLQQHGFETVVDQDELMKGSRIQTVYAIRPSDHRRLPAHGDIGGARSVPEAENRVLTAAALRQRISPHLPDYMVPSMYVILEDLPRSPNGKIDRSALPEPDWSRTDLAADDVPPSDELQRVLMRIWTEVLGVDSVGVLDDFLELGGDSIKAIRIINRIRQELKVDVPISKLIVSGTIASLAPLVSAESAQ